jgi:hypothetical protein
MKRRDLLLSAGAAAGVALAPRRIWAADAPTAPVALARCNSYGAEVLPVLRKLFDQIGGIGRLVKGKTVAVKLNLTGNPDIRVGVLPIENTNWTHPERRAYGCWRAPGNRPGRWRST